MRKNKKWANSDTPHVSRPKQMKQMKMTVKYPRYSLQKKTPESVFFIWNKIIH